MPGDRTVEVIVLQHGLAVEQGRGVRLELVLHQRAPRVVQEVNVAVPARGGRFSGRHHVDD